MSVGLEMKRVEVSTSAASFGEGFCEFDIADDPAAKPDDQVTSRK